MANNAYRLYKQIELVELLVWRANLSALRDNCALKGVHTHTLNDDLWMSVFQAARWTGFPSATFRQWWYNEKPTISVGNIQFSKQPGRCWWNMVDPNRGSWPDETLFEFAFYQPIIWISQLHSDLKWLCQCLGSTLCVGGGLLADQRGHEKNSQQWRITLMSPRLATEHLQCNNETGVHAQI